MPWATNAALPAHVRGALPPAAQTRFRQVANRILYEKKGSEESAIRQAWHAVKQGWKKTDKGWVRKSLDEIILLDKARPRTLYICRKVQNAGEIISWAKKQGFKTTLPAEELHTTVMYSRVPVDWMKMDSGYSGRQTIYIPEGGPRIVEPLGDQGAIVLMFTAPELEHRNRELRSKGASWDWPGYQPHVTITWDGKGVDLDKVEPFTGQIILGPEEYKEIDDDFKSKLVEKMLDAVEKYDPSQPRDDDGRWTDEHGEARTPDVVNFLESRGYGGQQTKTRSWAEMSRSGDSFESRVRRADPKGTEDWRLRRADSDFAPTKAGSYARDYEELLDSTESVGAPASAVATPKEYKEFREEMEFLDNSKSLKWMNRAAKLATVGTGLSVGFSVAAITAMAGLPKFSMLSGLAAGLGAGKLVHASWQRKLKRTAEKMLEQRRKELAKAEDEDEEDLVIQILERAIANLDKKTEKVDVSITKVDDNLGVVFGYAIICKQDGKDYFDLNVDRSSGKRVPEHITEKAMLEAALDFADSRIAKEMHWEAEEGTVPFIFPLTTEIAKAFGLKTNTTGLLIGMKPKNKRLLKKFQTGEYTGFSIGGSRVKMEVVEDE